MPTPGNLKTQRFSNHSLTTKPSDEILESHYEYLNMTNIENQTGYADWFLAVLVRRPGLQGHNGQLYVIYNPTVNGEPVTYDTDSRAKLCGAPCPPFCDGEQPGLHKSRLEQIEDKLEAILEKIKSKNDSKQ